MSEIIKFTFLLLHNDLQLTAKVGQAGVDKVFRRDSVDESHANVVPNREINMCGNTVY